MDANISPSAAEAVVASDEDSSLNPLNFTFKKTKGFSYLTYLVVNSQARLEGGKLLIDQAKKWFGFIPGKKSSHSLALDEISGIELKTKFAIWDTLFALVFIIIAIVAASWYWLLLSVLFIISAYGKVITIRTKANIVVTIPTNNSVGVQEFIAQVKPGS